jgi:hypothetical protein
VKGSREQPRQNRSEADMKEDESVRSRKRESRL